MIKQFTNLPPEKRTQLIGIVVGLLAFTGILYFTVWNAQTARLKRINAELKKTESQDDTIRKTLQRGPTIYSQLEIVSNKLAELEMGMASGDLYLWLFQTLKTFQTKHKGVELILGQTTPGPMPLLPKFPYSQVKIGVAGTAYYHDLGKFIADFENSFPLMRIENLSIMPVQGARAVEDKEKLNFKCEIVSLVKP